VYISNIMSDRIETIRCLYLFRWIKPAHPIADHCLFAVELTKFAKRNERRDRVQVKSNDIASTEPVIRLEEICETLSILATQSTIFNTTIFRYKRENEGLVG
jgi:hypothetical protein